MRSLWNVVLAACIVGAVAAGSVAAERERRERPGHGKELQQIEQDIRAGRSVTKRIERDPRAPADVKQRATELDNLLDTRERTLAKLDASYRDFVARHKAELDELEDLRKRALTIDQRLGEARTQLVQTNKADIDELKRNSQQARQLIDALRSSYELDRKTRHQR